MSVKEQKLIKDLKKLGLPEPKILLGSKFVITLHQVMEGGCLLYGTISSVYCGFKDEIVLGVSVDPIHEITHVRYDAELKRWRATDTERWATDCLFRLL